MSKPAFDVLFQRIASDLIFDVIQLVFEVLFQRLVSDTIFDLFLFQANLYETEIFTGLL